MSEIELGDRGTFFGTDGKEYDAVVTKVWDEGTVNLVHAAGVGVLEESTSVSVGDEYYGFKPGGTDE